LAVFFAGLGGFLLGAVLGYCAVLFGWLGYAEMFDVFDRDGGKIMGIMFGFAPMTALVTGIVGAIWLGRRAARRRAVAGSQHAAAP
jgi:hypothetical protein